MTCYLIDFENVHEDGFAGIGKVAQDDVVYCFFTRNAPKISLSVLAESKGIQFRFIEASAGKQSLDLALGSFLGFLIAQEEKDTRFVIVSNDTGYLKIADFWNRRLAPNTVRVCGSMEASMNPPVPQNLPEQKRPAERQRNTRRQMVRKPTAKPVAEAAQPVKEPIPVSAVSAPQPVKPMESSEPKTAQETQQKEPVTREEPDPVAIEYIQAQIAKYAGEKNIRQLVYRAIVRKYGQKQGTKLYNSIKKTITVQRSEPAKETQE